jgi:hypothetical protein
MTNHQAFPIIIGIIFGLVTLMHALRLTFHWQVKVNQREIPRELSVDQNKAVVFVRNNEAQRLTSMALAFE